METNPKSIYKRGAENGLPLGVYFCVLFFSMVFGEKFAALGLVSTALLLCTPVFVWHLLRRTYVEEKGYTIYAALWMQGITAFACGSLILCCAIYIYLRFIDPDFISRQVDLVLGVYGQIDNPRTQEMTDILQSMKEHHTFPSARDVVIQIFLMGVFSGSILSMLLAMLIRLRGLTTKELNKN